MSIDRRTASALVVAALSAPAFAVSDRRRTVAVLLDSLTSAFWQASLEALRSEAARRGLDVLEAVSNADDSRQYQQVLSTIRRGVDGIIIVHTDAKAVVPAIRAANVAGIPMVHFNRMPAPSDAYSVAVVADNRQIMRDAVAALVEQARRQGSHYKAAVLIGDLSDPNAVERRAGFDDVAQRNTDLLQVVARIVTDWNADKAFSGLTNALQANPDINLLVSPSDFLTPQIEQALRIAGKWHPVGHPEHVLIASFDGDETAYTMLAAGYFDVEGVQNLNYEVQLTFDALSQIWAGGHPEKILTDPGLIVRRAQLAQQRAQMWGYDTWQTKHTAGATQAIGEAATTGAASAGPAAGNWGGVALLAMAAALLKALFSIDTGVDIVLGMLPFAILVAGQVLVLITGQIDLSMTATMAACSVTAASIMVVAGGLAEPFRICLGVLGALAAGTAIGLFNGLCTAILRMPSFVVTLAVMTFVGGAAIWYAASISETASLGGLPHMFVTIGYGTVGKIPLALLVCVTVLGLIHWLLSHTLLGRWLFAVGHNARAARVAGVPVRGVTVAAFTLSGFCAGLAAIIYTARLETGSPTLGQNMLLDIVGAAVIGGVSLFGGRGSIPMALGGVLFVSILDKSLQLLGLSLFLVLAVKGVAILLAAAIDTTRHERRTFT